MSVNCLPLPRVDFLTLTSFGYLHSNPPADAARVVDVREILRDPARVAGLLHLTGEDLDVRRAVLETPGAHELLHELFVYAATLPAHRPAEIAIGCSGGRHRSVALVNELAEMLREVVGLAPHVRHQHIHLPRVLTEAEYPEEVIAEAIRFADHWLFQVGDDAEHLVVLGHPGQLAALKLVDAWTGGHVVPEQLLYTHAVAVPATAEDDPESWKLTWAEDPTAAAALGPAAFPVTVWSPDHHQPTSRP